MPEYVVEFPTLWVLPAWIEHHCPVPAGRRRGEPLELYDWQLWCIASHYRVRDDALWVPDKPLLGTAFVYRRSMFIGPQKTGKSPLDAVMCAGEAVGPALFAGWAGDDDGYDCRSNGCGCGWEYPYQPGEAMGMPWVTPLIQILGPSIDNTNNVYLPLVEMIKLGPLVDVLRPTETDVACPDGGKIEPVTSSAKSRIGNPITFAVQEETGWYTAKNKMIDIAETQRQGLAGMEGRSVESTNTWDPVDRSLAQKSYDADLPDVFKFYRKPPPDLDYTDPVQRHQVHVFNYEGSAHTTVASIDAEANEFVANGDIARAERFFGNRCHVGDSVAFDIVKWAANHRGAPPAPRSVIVIGVDGARFDDALAIVATDVATGFQWPLKIIERPENADDDYEHDFDAADGAMLEAFKMWRVWRTYIDPQRIEKLVERWQGRWKQKVVEWHTNRPKQVCFAVRNYRAAIATGDCTNDGDLKMAEHIGNARRRTESVKDDEGKPMFSIQKEFPGSPLKIDAAMAGLLSWECRGDAIAAGVNTRRSSGRIWD